MKLNFATSIAAVAVCCLPLLGCGERTEARGGPPRAEVAAAPPSASVPGAGVVDVPQGPLQEVPPMTFNRPGMETGKPVGVAGPDNKTGWVEWEDFSPSQVPVDDRIPRAMVPIRDKEGQQIAWWSTMGWITFETVSQPGYDFGAEYQRYLDENRADTCEEYEQMAGIDGVCADPPS